MQLGHVYDNRRLHAAVSLVAPPAAHDYLRPALGFLDRIDLVAGASA
jgi:hypothetical protein